jgi:SatD family (SatD)
MGDMQELYVILGDVISSKTLKNRAQFQEKLIQACEHINKTYNKDLYAKFDIIKGTDEIGAVLKEITHLYQIITEISGIIGLNRMRFVLIKGEIDIGLNLHEISRMDGPAFHQAASMMQELKKEKLIFKMSTADYIFDTLVTNTINLIHLLKKNWSTKKWEIISEYEKFRDQKTVASKFNIKQQDVSYHLNSSHFKEIKKIETDLKKVIKSYSIK